MSARRLDLVLLWHMHQPDYRDHASGEFTLPWVYLHAIKDYADMAWHLERHEVCAVVNFAPVLLDQLEDYGAQFAGGALRDPLLRLLAREESTPLTGAERQHALAQCFHADHGSMVEPFAAYRRLAEVHRAALSQGPEGIGYLADRYFYDLVTWYHLAWTGETVRRESEVVARLMSEGADFTHADRAALLAEVGALVRAIVPRYRALAASGRVELSTTPQHHPIGPLLLDFHALHEATPQAPLPEFGRYPGGIARLGAQIDAALASHAARFGEPARGMWPAEGAISLACLRQLGARGMRWVASGEGVLANSLREHGGYDRGRDLYHAYRADGADPVVFFRDDRLSDLIGFEYRRWHGRDAASNLIGELERIAREAPQGETPLVAVILDGENPWEHFPYNGFYFLSDLYQGLRAHAAIRTWTFSSFLARHGAAGTRTLPALKAGSWVQGNLLTWIGTPAKNRAWDLLCSAKQSFDLVISSGRLSAAAQDAARRQLSDCEGSDWFWWLQDGSPSPAMLAFDRLFRAKLAHLYRLLGLPAPIRLAEPICRGDAEGDSAAAMRRSGT